MLDRPTGSSTESVLSGWLNSPDLVVGVLTIVAAVVIFILQRKRKVLEYWLFTTPIVSKDRLRRDKVRVIYDGAPVESVYHTACIIRNSGELAVRASDFADPIRVGVSEDFDVLEGYATFRDSDEEIADVTVERHTVTLPPLLINPSDTIDIILVTTAPGDSVRLTGKAADTKIRQMRIDLHYLNRRIGIPAALGIVVVIALWIYTGGLAWSDAVPMGGIILFSAIIGALVGQNKVL